MLHDWLTADLNEMLPAADLMAPGKMGQKEYDGNRDDEAGLVNRKQ